MNKYLTETTWQKKDAFELKVSKVSIQSDGEDVVEHSIPYNEGTQREKEANTTPTFYFPSINHVSAWNLLVVPSLFRLALSPRLIIWKCP